MRIHPFGNSASAVNADSMARSTVRGSTSASDSLRPIGENVASGRQPELSAGIGEVGIGLDPGYVGAVGVALRLQQLEVCRGTYFVPVLGHATGLLAGLRLRAGRPAAGDVAMHCVPVATSPAAGRPARRRRP